MFTYGTNTRRGSSRSTFKLQPAHWWYVVAVLTTVLVVTVLAVSTTLIRDYEVGVLGPELQKCLGFTASEVSVTNGSEEMRMFAIASLREDSPLARAGIRPGDIPVGYHHGFAVGFYDDVRAALNGVDVSFRVLAASEWSKGSAAWRTVRLERLAVKCE